MSVQNQQPRVVFIAEGNNELDHYLPLISKYPGRVTIVFNPSIEVVLTNEVHQYICEKYDVQKVSLASFFDTGFKGFLLANLHSFFRLVYKHFQTKYIRKAFIYSLQLYKSSLVSKLNKGRVKEFFESYKWSVIDVKVLDLDKKSDPLISFLTSLESLGLKNLMISHGLTITYKGASLTSNPNFFKPVMMCCCNSREVASFQLQLPGVQISPVGDLRYDREYLHLLNKVHGELPLLEEKYRNRNSILYLVGNIPGEANEQCHRDIIYNCLEQFDSVVVKLHPRNPYYITEFLGNDRVIQASNEVDTSRLIEEHDWVITAFSGIIMHAVLQGKRSIMYRPGYLKDRTMIFDESKLFQVSSAEDLKEIKKTYNENRDELLKFYLEYYSAGKEESIIERHLQLLELN